MKTKIKISASLVLLSLLLTLVPSVGQAQERLNSIPYWSDTASQTALQKSAQNDIYSDPLRPENPTKGALVLSSEAMQLASTIEADALGIIKSSNLSESEQVDRLKELVYELYLPPAEWTGTYDPADPSGYFEQFGILNYLTLYLGSCSDNTPAVQTDDTYCGAHSWLQYPNGDDANNQTTNYATPAAAMRYYETQANLKAPIHATLGITLAEANPSAWLTGSGLLASVNAYLAALDSRTGEMLELRTVAVDPTNPTQFLDAAGKVTNDETEAATMPEYSLASTQLYHLITPDQSLLTGKDASFWGLPSRGLSVMEITTDFKSLSFVRASSIFEKAKKQKEDQYNAIRALVSEINTVYGTLSASPYDMSTVVSTLEAKYKVIDALGGPCKQPEDGYQGCIDAATNSEPLAHPDHAARIQAINDLLTTGGGSARKKYEDYRKQYESSPNLSNATTAASFEAARDALLAARDAMLRYLSDLSELATSRIEEADQSLSQLQDTLSSDVASTGAVNAIWGEVKRALVGLSTWLVNIFGRSLNFGLTEINIQADRFSAVPSSDNATLANIHAITLGMANISFVLLIVIAGLMVAMEWNIQAYSLRRLIPRFVVSAVLVNSSLFFARIALDFSLILTNILLAQASAVSNNVLNVEIFARATAGTSGSTALGLSGAAPGLLFGSLLSSNIAALANSVFQNDIAAVIVLLLIVLIVAAVDILLIVRTVGVWLLMITSPLILMLNVLPSTSQLIGRYVKLFLQLILIGPIVAIIFLIGIALAQLSLSDDFLRVLIGIGTFALMLFSPMFLSFMSSLVKVKLHRERDRSDRTFRVQTDTTRPGRNAAEPAQISNTSIQKEVKSSLVNTQITESTKAAGLVNLSPQALETAVKSGIMVNIEADQLSNILGKLDKSQRQSLLATFDDRDQRAVPLWTEEQKNVIREIVTPEEITRAVNQADLIGKTRSLGEFDIDSLLRKNIGQKSGMTPQPTDILVNLLINHRLGELEDRLVRLAGQKMLTPEVSAKLLEIQEGMRFVAGLLASPEPKVNQTGTVITESYFGTSPEKIVERSRELTTTADPSDRQAYEAVLRVGIAELGNRLMQSPDDPELRRVAADLVLAIPNDIKAAFSSEGPEAEARRFFLAQGSGGASTTSASSEAQPALATAQVETLPSDFDQKTRAAAEVKISASEPSLTQGVPEVTTVNQVTANVVAEGVESGTPSIRNTLSAVGAEQQTDQTLEQKESVARIDFASPLNLEAAAGAPVGANILTPDAEGPTQTQVEAEVIPAEALGQVSDQDVGSPEQTAMQPEVSTAPAINGDVTGDPPINTATIGAAIDLGNMPSNLESRETAKNLTDLSTAPSPLASEKPLNQSIAWSDLASATIAKQAAGLSSLGTTPAPVREDQVDLDVTPDFAESNMTAQVTAELTGIGNAPLAGTITNASAPTADPQIEAIRATVLTTPTAISTDQVVTLMGASARGDQTARVTLDTLIESMSTSPEDYAPEVRGLIVSAGAMTASAQSTLTSDGGEVSGTANVSLRPSLLKPTATPRELLDNTLSTPEQLESQDIQTLLTRYEEEPVLMRDALSKVVSVYNDNVRGEYPDQIRLAPDTIAAVQASGQALSDLGFPLRLSREQAGAELTSVNQFAKIPADRLEQMSPEQYVPTIGAFVENYPQLVLPEHIHYALNRMEDDPDTYRPIIQKILSPAFALPTLTVSRGLDRLIESKPEWVLPEHITRSLQGLQTGNDTFASNMQSLGALYNRSGGAYGGDGQLTLPANTELSLQNPQIARLLPDVLLTPYPSQDPLLNGAIIAKGNYDQLHALPDSLIASGMNALIERKPELITADQVGATLVAATQNSPLMLPVLSGLVDRYNASSGGIDSGLLPLPAMMTLASQAENLSAFGFQLNPGITAGLKQAANDRGFDLGGFDRLENAIREIPRALKRPPGSESGGAKADDARMVTFTESGKGSGSSSSGSYHATQEALASDNIVQKIQAAKEQQAELKGKKDGFPSLEGEDLEDYVENIKEHAGELGVMRPDLEHTPEALALAQENARERAEETTETTPVDQISSSALQDETPTLAALAMSVPLLEAGMSDDQLYGLTTSSPDKLTSQDIDLLIARHQTAPEILTPALEQLLNQLTRDDQGAPSARLLRLDASQTLRSNLDALQALGLTAKA